MARRVFQLLCLSRPILVALCLLAARQACADPAPLSSIPISTAAILELRFVDLPPALAEQVQRRLQQALNIEGYRVVDELRAQQKIREEGPPPVCVIGPCLSRVARVLKVDRVLVGGVRSQGSSYDFTLTLLETGGGSLLAQVTERCDVCSFKELEDAVGRATAQLHKQALVYLSYRSLLKINSTPSGADVLLDDLFLGHTPLSQVVTPGAHTLEVAVRGRAGVKQQVTLRAGKTSLVQIDLGRFATVAGREPAVRRLIPRWLLWTTLGAGFALCGAGVGLWAIDGRETSDPRYLHDTSGTGIALLSVGASALATSALLYFLDRPQQRRALTSRVPGIRNVAFGGLDGR